MVAFRLFVTFLFLSFCVVHSYLSLKLPRNFIVRLRNRAEISTKQPSLQQHKSTMSTSNPARIPSKKLVVFNVFGVSSKFIVSSLAAIVLLWTDSWAPLFYILAAITNGLLSKVIKKTLKQPRPLQSVKGGYGMPSSHAQSFFFFLTVLVVNHQRIFPNGYLALITCFALAVYTVVANSWRITTRLHTTAQTVVGGMLGAAVAISASRIESTSTQLLQRFFVMMTGENDTHHAVWTAKIFITLAAMLFICKREIESLTDWLRRNNTAGQKPQRHSSGNS